MVDSGKDSKSKAQKVANIGRKNNEGRKSLGIKGRLFLIAFILLGLAFLPTSMLLFFGMLPSIVAFFVGARGRGVRASTIVAMNLAGCVPFVFKLWTTGNDFEASIDIVSDMQSLVIMYMAAAFGYMIDWVVTGIVSSYLYQKGINRMKAIRKRQKALIELWGEEVSGNAVDENSESGAG